MKDIIQLDENNRCVSANCIYTEDDKTIEYQFESEDERISFFENIQDYVYQHGKFIVDKLPEPEPQPSEQDQFNAMILKEIALLKVGV